MQLHLGVGLAKAIMYAVLAMLVIPAMLYGYDRAKPDGCSIDGQVWTYAYLLDTPDATTDATTDVPTHAGLIVREGEKFVVADGTGQRWRVIVREDGQRDLRPNEADRCAISERATDTGRYWLVGERMVTDPDNPLANGEWQYSIQGISPVAEQIGRTIWPLVGFILVTGLLTMAVREAVK